MILLKNIFICGLIILILMFYKKSLFRERTNYSRWTFIYLYALVFIHSYLNNEVSENSFLITFYKFLIILSSLSFLILCFIGIRQLSIRTLRFREELFDFFFSALLLSIIPLRFFSLSGIYVLEILMFFTFMTLLLSHCPYLMSKSIKYEYKLKQVSNYRNNRVLHHSLISLALLFEKVSYEFKLLRKLSFKIKYLSILLFIGITALWLISFLWGYKFPDNILTLICFLCLLVFMFYIFALVIKYIVIVSYLILLTALSQVGKSIRENKLAKVIGLIIILRLLFINISYALFIICFIVSIIFIENLCLLNKNQNRNRLLQKHFNYRIAAIIAGKFKRFIDSSIRKHVTYYIAVNISMCLWFLSIIFFILIFKVPQEYIIIVLYILIIPIVYYILRLVMYFKINELSFFLFLLFSSFVLYIANVKMLNGLHVILSDYKVPTDIFNIRVDLVLTGIEYILLILILVNATTLTTIDPLKRTLTLLFALTTTIFIVFRYVPHIVFPDVNFQEADVKVFQVVSNFSFVPSLIGTLIGTIYIDIVKKRHEEKKKREEERALKALIYKSSLARPLI